MLRTGLPDKPAESPSAAMVPRHAQGQTRHGTFWTGGTLQAFTEQLLFGKCPYETLQAWEEALLSRGSPHQKAQAADIRYLYLFSTDDWLTELQRTTHRILALAGHPLAARIIVVSKTEQLRYHGFCMMMQREVSRIVGQHP